MKRTLTLIAIGLLGSTLFAQTATPGSQKVAIRFSAVLGGKPFACGQTYENVGSSHAAVTPTDLRFFISHVELLDAAGNATQLVLDQDGTFQYHDLALIDMEDGTGGCRNGNPAMHLAITGTAPAGSYTGVKFIVGVPFELDHLDPVSAPAPLNFTAMSWAWQSGFKFIRAEVAVKPVSAAQASPKPQASAAGVAKRGGLNMMGAESGGFPVHIGSTGCTSPTATTAPMAECAHPNRVVVTLTDFDPGKDTVLFDLDHLFANSDVTRNTPHSAPGCMSFPDDPDCAPIFHALGLAFREDPATEQSVFQKAPR